jgi:adenylylsulfate kinase
VITGPVAVGKSTIANEAAWLLRPADIPHALVDLDRIEQSWPVPAGDPGNERVGLQFARNSGKLITSMGVCRDAR